MTKTYENMTKAELIEHIEHIEKLQSARGKNRKQDVLNLLQDGYDSIEAIAEEVGITKKNVSSILSALRKQGHTIINFRAGGQSVLQLIHPDDVDKYFNK